MPPIAPSPQGSRAGLITSLVIFVILFMTSAILAIYYYTQLEAEKIHNTAEMSVLKPAVRADIITNNTEVQKILADAKSHPPVTGIEEAIHQRNDVSKLINGNPTFASVEAITNDTLRATKEVEDKVKAAGAPVTITPDNLLADLRSLANQITSLTTSVTQAEGRAVDAKKKTDAANAEKETALKEKDAQIDAANKKAAAAEEADKNRQTDLDAKLKAIKDDTDKAIAAANQQTTVAQTELSKVQSELKKSQDATIRAINKLREYRLNPSLALMQPPGQITRVPGNNTVFINLGQGQQISPGLTFEVYDKRKGLPPLLPGGNPDNPEALTPGKASIEVIRVMEATSECRIIHEAVGMHCIEGDLILNLIYNTHTKFAFFIYGDFDLSNSGQATPGDGDVLRRLVSQWGGRVIDQVNVDTDFVVLGKEPVVPPLPESPTALDQERHDKAVKAFDAYQAFRGAAINLTIPILNQNRFLYFVGYYDQARR